MRLIIGSFCTTYEGKRKERQEREETDRHTERQRDTDRQTHRQPDSDRQTDTETVM